MGLMRKTMGLLRKTEQHSLINSEYTDQLNVHCSKYNSSIKLTLESNLESLKSETV